MKNRIKKLEEVVYLLRNDYMTNKKDIRELEKRIADFDHRLVYLEEENLRRERAEVVAEAVAIEKELQSIENGTYDYEG